MRPKALPKKSYICDECKSQYPTHYYICPNCKAYNSFHIHTKETVQDRAMSSDLFKGSKKFKTQMDLFNYKWKTCRHNSFISNDKIDIDADSEFFNNIFAHVLPKGQFQYFKLYDKNIVLLLPIEHHLIDHGTKEEREEYVRRHPNCNFNLFYDLYDELKYEYNQYLKTINKQSYEQEDE